MSLFIAAKWLRGNETGVALLETLVALAILGLTAVAFVGGLGTAVNADIIADEQATAESLARSQLEWVKKADYAPSYSPEPVPDLEDYTGYLVTIVAVPLPGYEDDIQRVTVEVEHKGETVLSIEGYKAER